MTTITETKPLTTDELRRLKESITPENRCELAYSGETVARLIETLSLQFLKTSQLQEKIDRCYKIAMRAGKELSKERFGLVGSSLDDLAKLTVPPAAAPGEDGGDHE